MVTCQQFFFKDLRKHHTCCPLRIMKHFLIDVIGDKYRHIIILFMLVINVFFYCCFYFPSSSDSVTSVKSHRGERTTYVFTLKLPGQSFHLTPLLVLIGQRVVRVQSWRESFRSFPHLQRRKKRRRENNQGEDGRRAGAISGEHIAGGRHESQKTQEIISQSSHQRWTSLTL